TGGITAFFTHNLDIIVKALDQGKTALKNADHFANSNIGRRQGQHVTAPFTDLALQYATFPESNENRFKKLLRNSFFFRQFGNENRFARGMFGEIPERLEGVFSLF